MKQLLHVKKYFRSALLFSIIGFWILLNSIFINNYIKILTIPDNTWIKSLFTFIVIFWILLTSFYSSYHLMSFLFSLFIRRKRNNIVRNYDNTPPVAVLYTCMNDLKKESIIACLSQEYPNYSLYVLDDSTIKSEKKLVNSLKKEFNNRFSIIRRKRKGFNGFKAGNINNAIHKIGNQYDYICIIDSDELIPQTFIRETVAIAEGNKKLGFVQCSHQQYSKTKYGKLTGDGIDLHWNYFLPARNKFGFVYFYGHGALLRLKSIIDIGGFPEVVSEDIALTVRMRQYGYQGYFAHDIKCLEETPSSYRSFRRRNRKITSGTLEFLKKFYPDFFRSKKVPFVEKIDMLISTSIIYLPIPFFCFIFILHYLIPFLEIGSNKNIISFLNVLIYSRAITKIFNPLWNWKFIAFIFFTVFSPLCYVIPNIIQSPKKTIFYILRMGTISLSISLQTIGVTLKWVITKRTFFIATGDRSQKASGLSYEYLEFFLGLILYVSGILSSCFCLISVGFTLMLVPILMKKELEESALSKLSIIPMLIAFFTLSGLSILLIGITGIFTGVALANY